jgi:hypothetical protein
MNNDEILLKLLDNFELLWQNGPIRYQSSGRKLSSYGGIV